MKLSHMPKALFASLFPAVALLFTSVGAQAAVKLNYERKQAGDSGPPGTATMTIDAEHIRMDGMGAGRPGHTSGAMIVDAPGKRFLIIDNEKKSYHELTEADVKQMKDRMAGMRAQMQERMKNAPPEQRKRAEEMMGRMGGGDHAVEIKYTPLGTKKKVSGFACEMYRVQIGNISSSEACISPWSANVITKTEVEHFQKLSAELQKSFDFGGNRLLSEWTKAPGLTVEQTHMGVDGKPEWTSTLKSITRGDVPASTFAPPAGFTKETSPMFGGGRMGGHRGPGGGPPSP